MLSRAVDPRATQLAACVLAFVRRTAAGPVLLLLLMLSGCEPTTPPSAEGASAFEPERAAGAAVRDLLSAEGTPLGPSAAQSWVLAEEPGDGAARPSASCSARGFRATLTDGTLVLSGATAPERWRLELRWSGFGRSSAPLPVPSGTPKLDVQGTRAEIGAAPSSQSGT